MPTSTAATTTRASSPDGQAGELDRHAQRRARPHRRGQLHVDGERVRDLVDREPLHADGPSRHALRGRVERTPQCRDHVGARPPIAAHVKAHARGAGLDVLRLAGDEPIGEDIHRQPARGPCGHRDVHRLARLVVRLVERDFKQIGRVRRRIRIEARIESDRRDGAVRFAGRDFQAIAAPFHRQRQPRRLVGSRHRPCRSQRARCA